MGSGRFFPVDSGCRLKRKLGYYRCTATVGLNLQISAKASQSLSHPAKANSGAIGANRHLLVQRDALTCVFHLDNNGTILFANRDDRGIAAGVAMNIGETLLD